MTDPTASPPASADDGATDPSSASPSTAEADSFDTETVALAIAEACWDIKAHNVRAIDVRGLASYTDFLVVCHGTSERHARSIAEHVLDELRPTATRTLGREGFEGGEWLLVDFGDAVLHVFHGESRTHYGIESLWCDAPRLSLDAPKDLEFPDEASFAIA